MKPKILVFAGSTRNHSINKQLAQIAAAKANELGGEGVLIDLADYEMPLYHGDVERDDGIPDAARRFAELVSDADGIVIASPEYNGAYSPLLKNTIDWVTRVDKASSRGQPPSSVGHPVEWVESVASQFCVRLWRTSTFR